MAIIQKSISIDFNNNNISYKDGDALLIQFNSAWGQVDSFVSYTETTSPIPTTNDFFISSLFFSMLFFGL